MKVIKSYVYRGTRYTVGDRVRIKGKRRVHTIDRFLPDVVGGIELKPAPVDGRFWNCDQIVKAD